jgi:hypothetical protein
MKSERRRRETNKFRKFGAAKGRTGAVKGEDASEAEEAGTSQGEVVQRLDARERGEKEEAVGDEKQEFAE